MIEPQPVPPAPTTTLSVTFGRVLVCIGLVIALAGAFFTFPLGPEPFQLVLTVPAVFAGLLLVGAGALTSGTPSVRWKRIAAWLLMALALFPILWILTLYFGAVA